jgi:hypothetical protein
MDVATALGGGGGGPAAPPGSAPGYMPKCLVHGLFLNYHTGVLF